MVMPVHEHTDESRTDFKVRVDLHLDAALDTFHESLETPRLYLSCLLATRTQHAVQLTVGANLGSEEI